MYTKFFGELIQGKDNGGCQNKIIKEYFANYQLYN